MNLNPHRPWITPLVIGAFGLSAVTGVLMFFHLDTGLNKAAHEWLSWAMLVGVTLHALVNFTAFERYFGQPRGRWVIAAFAALLAFSFVPLGGKGEEPPFAAPVRALARVPLPVLAQVAGHSTEDLRQSLKAAGVAVTSDEQTLEALVGPGLRTQVRVLSQLMPPDSQRR